jgi:hypothetical protein
MKKNAVVRRVVSAFLVAAAAGAVLLAVPAVSGPKGPLDDASTVTATCGPRPPADGSHCPPPITEA